MNVQRQLNFPEDSTSEVCIFNMQRFFMTRTKIHARCETIPKIEQVAKLIKMAKIQIAGE